jgi:hypothetical protein
MAARTPGVYPGTDRERMPADQNEKNMAAIAMLEEARDRCYDLAASFNAYNMPRVQMAKRNAIYKAETEFRELATLIRRALDQLGHPLVVTVGDHTSKEDTNK